MRLAEALEQTAVGALRRMASAHGLLHDDGTTRVELIERLAERRGSDPAFSFFCLASTLGRPAADLDTEVRPWSEEPGGWEREARWRFLRHLGQSAGLLVPRADGVLVAAGGLARLLDNPPALA